MDLLRWPRSDLQPRFCFKPGKLKLLFAQGTAVLGTLLHTFDHMLKLNYADVEWNIGGNLWFWSIEGAVGMTDIYVNQHINPESVSWPTNIHSMYKIGRH